MPCPACSFVSPPGYAVCARCGVPLNGTAPPPAPPPQYPPPSPAAITLVCIAGPDLGRRLTVGGQEMTVGRAPGSGLASADPDVAPDHAGLIFTNGILQFRKRAPAPLSVNGMDMDSGTLLPGQQLRLGNSYWQVEQAQVRAAPAFNAGQAAANLFGQINTHVGAATGIGGLDGFRPAEMFSSLRDKHSDEEIEEYFITGTRLTTPTLNEIVAVWPKPWVFFKVFLLLIALYAACAFGVSEFNNEKILPSLMVIGSFAIPISVLLFYFEMNVPRNVSIYQVFKMVLVGGMMSLIVSLFGYDWFKAFDFLGGLMPGIIEETGKTAALILFVNNRRYPWTLNGLLLGGAVGVGFAGFESAGYAFDTFLNAPGNDIATAAHAVSSSVLLRGVLAPGGHVAWAALEGAALWKVKGDQPFRWSMIQDWRFVRVFLLAVGLHTVWDAGLFPGLDRLPDIVFLPVQLLLMVVALTAVLSFVQDGIKQVREAQTLAGIAPTPV